MVSRAVAEPHGFKCLLGPVMPFFASHPVAIVEQRKFHVVERGRTRKKVESLEDETDSFVSHRGERVLGESRDVVAVKHISAAARPVEAPQDMHEG